MRPTSTKTLVQACGLYKGPLVIAYSYCLQAIFAPLRIFHTSQMLKNVFRTIFNVANKVKNNNFFRNMFSAQHKMFYAKTYCISLFQLTVSLLVMSTAKVA